MNKLRYNELMRGTASLTQDEVTQGWHFCPDWDFLLIGPGRTYEIRRQENLSSEKGRW
jgi:hypothetical protein